MQHRLYWPDPGDEEVFQTTNATGHRGKPGERGMAICPWVEIFL